MEFFTAAVDAFKALGPGNAAVFTLLIIFGGCARHWVTTVAPKQHEERKKEREMLHSTVNSQQNYFNELHVLLTNNTKAIEFVGQSYQGLSSTFEKVSDMIASHDERSVHITTMIQAQTQSIAALVEAMPKNETIKHIHDRMDTMTVCLADKGDINQICTSLSDINHKLESIKEKVTEIRVRA